jgi:cell wall-associated NlpC family hydrolase
MRWLKVLSGVIAIVVIGTLATVYLLIVTAFDQNNRSTAPGGNPACAVLINSATGTTDLDEDQVDNAETIVVAGARMEVPVRGLIIGVATALQESQLRNLNYGDRDSVGLFQQRPSAGWGSVAELTDPPTSASKFFAALLEVPNWQSMPLTEAAQAVQRSAFPNAYAKWESLSTTLVTTMVGGADGRVSPSGLVELDCGDVAGAMLPTGIVSDMLSVARRQLGEPYVWGGTGPNFFDCSGLVVYSWLQVGHPLAVRTSEQMYQVSTEIPAGQEQPGDLLFGHFDADGPGHVMIVVTPGVAIEAPHTGDVVKIVDYDVSEWTVGRLAAEAFLSGQLPD